MPGLTWKQMSNTLHDALEIRRMNYAQGVLDFPIFRSDRDMKAAAHLPMKR